MNPPTISKKLRPLLIGAALTATGAVAIGASPAAAGPAAGSETCFDSGAPEGAAVVVNGTAALATGPGFLNLYASSPDATPTENSSVNFSEGAPIANSVIVPVESDGQTCIYNSTETEVIVDRSGYVAPGSFVPLVDGVLRAFDSRVNNGRKYRSTDAVCGAPIIGSSPGDLLFFNVTAAAPEATGFLNVYPQGASSAPDANSVVNYVAGSNIANGSSVTLGDDAELCLYSSQRTHLILDVIGYIPAAMVRSATADNSALRALDTRESGSLAADSSQCVATDAAAGEAVVVNATAVNGSEIGFLNLYPAGAPNPSANSLVNFQPGANFANGTIVPAGTDGEICVYTSAGVDVLLDISSYTLADTFVPDNADGSATRIFDTREG